MYLLVSSVIKHCSICRGILVLSTVYKISANILLSKLSPYLEELLGIISLDFERNRSTTDHIFYIRQILEKKWDYKEAVHQLFMDFKRTYDSVRVEVFYNVLIEFGIPMKRAMLIKYDNKINSRVLVGKHLSDMFPI